MYIPNAFTLGSKNSYNQAFEEAKSRGKENIHKLKGGYCFSNLREALEYLHSKHFKGDFPDRDPLSFHPFGLIIPGRVDLVTERASGSRAHRILSFDVKCVKAKGSINDLQYMDDIEGIHFHEIPETEDFDRVCGNSPEEADAMGFSWRSMFPEKRLLTPNELYYLYILGCRMFGPALEHVRKSVFFLPIRRYDKCDVSYPPYLYRRTRYEILEEITN